MQKLFILSTKSFWREILQQKPGIAEFLLKSDDIETAENISHILVTPEIDNFPTAIIQKNRHLQYCLLVEKKHEHEVSKLPFTPQQKIFLPLHINNLFKQLEFFLSASKPKMLDFAEWQLDTDRRILQNQQITIPLSDAENALLSSLIENAEKSTSRESLLQEILGYHKDSTTHTLETHIYRLRQKLQNHANAPLISTTEDGYLIKAKLNHNQEIS